MANDFNIRDLYTDAFGKEPPADFGIAQASGRTELSSYGQPYYTVDDLGREHFLPIKLNGILLPFATIAITLRKNFGTPEQMTERRGRVHELVNIDDYVFNIKGILVSGDNNFPEAQYNQLLDLFHINKSLTLDCVKTAALLKGDDKVIIKDIPLPPTPGVQNAQVFEINLESDLIYTLELE